MRLTKKQRENLAKVSFNLSQIIFAVIIIGKAITPDKVSDRPFIVGIFVFVLLVLFGLVLDKGD